MLDKLQKLALLLRPLSRVFLILAILALSYGIYVLLVSRSQSDDLGLIPALMLFTWATMARSFIGLFAHVPPRAEQEMKFVTRIKARLSRALYYCFLTLFAIATGFLLLTTWQLSSAWRMMY
jgi:hypothetical protein